MRKLVTVALAAASMIMMLGGCSVHPAPAGNVGADAATTAPAAKTAGVTSGTSPGEQIAARPRVAPGTYLVRTIWEDDPLPQVRVEWRHRVDDALPALSAGTIRFGTADFHPVSGSYYLTADWRPDGDYARPLKTGDLFGWLGKNPLLVSSAISGEITLTLDKVPPLPAVPTSGTGIFGRVTLKGAPVAGVGVYAYAKTVSGFKGNDFQALVRTNAKGEFTLDLPPGRYYLIARLRTADKSVSLGPLHKNDLLGYDPRNPVVVKEGHVASAAIPMTRLQMLKPHAEYSTFRLATIVGRIVDRSGRPVSGAYAALYDNPQMINRPTFRSVPTGADGKFNLSVPLPGKYFFGARSGYGGPPAAGGWFGTWGGNADHSISVKAGEVRSGIEIVVDRLTQMRRPIGNP